MISIIIPTLNEEKRIETTLRRLMSNFTLSHEVIVSDGQSKDRTVEIARGLATHVVEFPGGHRQTIAEGRNDGAKKATGEFLVFMDADCIIENPDQFFSTLIREFEKHPKLVAVTTFLHPLQDEALFMDYVISFFTNLTYRMFNNLLGKGASPGEFQMIKKTAFDKVGGFNPKLVAGEDVDMFNRLSKIGVTRFETKTALYHSCRRAHKIGWPKLLSEWFLNTVWLLFLGRAHSKEWEPIR